MSDLTEAELLAATTVHDRLKAVNETAWVDPVALIQCDQLQRAALEIQRHRSALAADRERVRSVVREAALHVLGDGEDVGKFMRAVASQNADAIATRAAEQLATAPAPPSKRKRLVTDTCESCGALPGSLCVGPTECEA